MSATEHQGVEISAVSPALVLSQLLGVAALLTSASVLAQVAPVLPLSATPVIEALPIPLTRPSIDLGAIARGYAGEASDEAIAAGLQRGPGLIVFVSLAMPRPTLDRLLDQATRARASVVLRGFADGSLRQTVAQLQALIGTRAISIQVDPPAFDRFGIMRVPSFVLLRDGARALPCAAGSCPPPGEHLQAAGDVSLDYALSHMQRMAPGFQAETAYFLQRLRP